MRSSALLVALACAASTLAQAVPEGIAPSAAPPSGCKKTVNGNFTIGIAIDNFKTRRETAVEAAGTALECSLKDGVLHDTYNRVGSIVANFQFQFDGPPQAGAIFTGGFSVCSNNSLALGGTTIFWRCMSGDFGNLYDRHIGDQCQQVRIIASLKDDPKTSSSSIASSTPASTVSTGPATLSSAVSRNGTQSTGLASSAGSTARITGLPTASSAGASASPSRSTGGAVATRVARRETFGAVVGILGAALIL